MARGVVSLRYMAARLKLALDEALNAEGSSLTDALERARQAYDRTLTGVVYVTGAAMAPTLNPRAAATATAAAAAAAGAGAAAAGAGPAGSAPAVEKLLVRWLPHASPSSVFVGDVVAFASPLSPPDPDGVAQPAVLVRRVVATEGDEMVCDEDDSDDDGSGISGVGGVVGGVSAAAAAAAVPWRIPRGHCWVLADNDALPAHEAIDSRAFGPLPFSSVLGRVLYRAASPTRHGPVLNSPRAAAADGPVLAAELDAEEFAGDLLAGGGDSGGGSSGWGSDGGEPQEEDGRQR